MQALTVVCTTAALGWLLGGGAAQALEDPTRPDLATASPAEPAQKGETLNLRVKLLVAAAERPAYAIIDGQKVRVGDVLLGARVMEISGRGVVLATQSERVLLRRSSCVLLGEDGNERAAPPGSRFAQCTGVLHADADTSGAIEIPLEREPGGTFRIEGLVNDKVKVAFVLDTGASLVSLPSETAQQLVGADEYAKLPSAEFVIADGSSSRKKRLVLKSLAVGGVVVGDVEASVANLYAPPLLGMSFLEKLGSWRIDTQKGVLVVDKKKK